MKYIELFEARKYRDEEERIVGNLARRLEYNINKFFNTTKKGDLPYTYVNYFKKNGEVRLSFLFNLGYRLNDDRMKVFKDEVKDLSAYHKDSFIYSFEFSIEEARQLVASIKNKLPKDLIEIDTKKYNL